MFKRFDLMVNITFYGGVNEVGGNKVLIEDEDVKVLFDFGMSFALRGKFYSAPFLSPKSGLDLIELGILPDLSGLYDFDDSKPEIDAVFLSHSHMDHSAHISFLKRDIPVYCGETTATILHALSAVRPTNLEFNLKGIKFRTFRTGDKIRVGSIEVKPVHVDHSVPGSYGFIIHTSSGTIIYTGDFRRHGLRPELTEDFLEVSASEKPEAVICENTNMAEVEFSSESEVRAKLNHVVADTTNLVLTEFSYADTDRLKSFYEVALKNDRWLTIPLKQAYLLHKLSQDPNLDIPRLNDGNILVFRKEKKRYFRWEREIMDFGETISPLEVSKKQNKIILSMSFFDLGWLVEINPSPGSCYILSASEPFNEEMEIDFNRLLSWLEHYGLPQYHIHVSGHIMPLHLREAMKIIKPRKIFPIHGNYPRLFSKFIGDISSKIIVPEKGKKYEV
ncbi:MAG TPA: MBL fold metallo-hydrolase [Candidatus Bathyarchaeota archaeon]|nr:MBL fold metallo-hydrolase [Candidatus Bathyarchaeota archaeon]